jgi:hypothetical protein
MFLFEPLIGRQPLLQLSLTSRSTADQTDGLESYVTCTVGSNRSDYSSHCIRTVLRYQYEQSAVIQHANLDSGKQVCLTTELLIMEDMPELGHLLSP